MELIAKKELIETPAAHIESSPNPVARDGGALYRAQNGLKRNSKM
jgi:hypothetical protein